MNRSSALTTVVILLTLNGLTRIAFADLTDYINGVKTYFGYESAEINGLEEYETKIPYEVAEADQKFISQAIELTGVAVSELDACQHRLILKLKNDCHLMNDIQLSKLAVGLLNCQSYIEGRKVYPCSEEMTLKSCTSDMDADVWNSYHLMTNRARAVCYSIRQTQFRGLTEHTVNRLMEASQNQLHTLKEISKDTHELQGMAENTIDFISKGHQDLVAQQKDLQKAQLYGQLQIEDNINKLADEKRLIIESQIQLAEMTKLLQEKLAIAAKQIEKQSIETGKNHNEVLNDLNIIQEKAQVIFKKIDESSHMLVEQSELAFKQYVETLNQLKEMNSTVNALVQVVGGTRKALEERLQWIIDLLGGTDDAIDRVYTFLWHLLLLVISMISAAFMNASFATRLVVITAIPANLVLTILKVEQAADPLRLGTFLSVFIVLQTSVIKIWYLSHKEKSCAIDQGVTRSSRANSYRRGSYYSIPDTCTNIASVTPPRSTSRSTRCSYSVSSETSFADAEVSRVTNYSARAEYATPHSRSKIRNLITRKSDSIDSHEESRDRVNEYISPTPPLSRTNYRARSRASSVTRTCCTALTRLGTPCKNPASAGGDVCYRHVKGDSIAR